MVNSTQQEPNVTIIQPKSKLPRIDIPELWKARELLFFLVWRDVKVRYKQTILGVAWAVLQPLLAMLIFTIFFGRFAKIPSDGFPYPVFVFCALLPWQLFAYSLTESANSLEQPNWTPMMTNTVGIDTIPVVDTNSTSLPQRFYRLLSTGP